MDYFTDISSGSSNTHVRIIESGSTFGGDPFMEAYTMAVHAELVKYWARQIFRVESNLTEAEKDFEEQKNLFNQIPPLLLEPYRGLFVASRNGQIVDSDMDFVDLTHRFFRNAGDVPVYIIKIGEDEGISLETPFSLE